MTLELRYQIQEAQCIRLKYLTDYIDLFNFRQQNIHKDVKKQNPYQYVKYKPQNEYIDLYIYIC